MEFQFVIRHVFFAVFDVIPNLFFFQPTSVDSALDVRLCDYALYYSRLTATLTFRHTAK